MVHVSELAQSFVQDPNEVVKVGQIVKVKVLAADPKTQRIGRSIKALREPPMGKPQHRQPSVEDKLAALANRRKSRGAQSR